MDTAATDRAPLAEEQLEIESSNSEDGYATVGPTGCTEDAEYADSASENAAIPCGVSTNLPAADIKQGVHLKHEGSTKRQPKTSRRKPCSLSADTRPISDGNVTADASGAASNEEEERWQEEQEVEQEEGEEGEDREQGQEEQQEEERDEEDEVVETAASSNASVWVSRGMLAGAAILYGSDFACLKLLQETVDVSLVAALRFTLAVVPFLPFVIKINSGVFRVGVEIGLFEAVGFWTQSKSLITTSASRSAFICSLSVLVVPLIDAVLGNEDEEESEAAKATEEVDKKHHGVVFAIFHGPWLPALLAVAGVACLELVGVEMGAASIGDVWALGQPLCFGVSFWLIERGSREYPGGILGIVAARSLMLAILAIGWCALARQIPVSFESLHETVLPSSGSLAVPLSLLWSALIATALTAFVETLAMEKVSAADSTVILSTEPIWGTVVAAVLLGETIGWNTGIGATLIVLACIWSSVGPAIQSKLLPLFPATQTEENSPSEFIVNAHNWTETVGTNSYQGARKSLDFV